MNKSGNEAELKASVTLTGDGTTKEYYFGFDYLNPEYIKVAVGGTSLSYPTDYSVVDRKVILTEVPEKGAEIWIHRQTESSRIIQWADGAFIKASQMTLESLQQLHLIEETQDYIMLNSISTYPDGENFNALGHRIINVADPTEAQDAVTKHYMESVQDGFVQRNKKIESHVQSMQEDVTNKQKQASASANLAKAWAISTETPDNATDTESTTGKTQSARTWALRAEELAENIGNPVSNVTESNSLVTVTKSDGAKNTFYAGLNVLARNKTYSVGDIAYSPNLPSWAYLECTTAGTTGATEPDFSTVTTKKQ